MNTSEVIGNFLPKKGELALVHLKTGKIVDPKKVLGDKWGLNAAPPVKKGVVAAPKPTPAIPVKAPAGYGWIVIPKR